MPKFMKSKWFLPAVVLLNGGWMAVVIWRMEGKHSEALKGLGLIFVIALALLAVGYNKKLRRELLGDERSDAINLFAGWAAGAVLAEVTFICFVVESERGRSVFPYFWQMALYVGLLLLFQFIQKVRR
jgi:hypothetical protein